MKHTSVALTAFLGVALAASPLAAFAEDSASLNTSGYVQTSGGGESSQGVRVDARVRAALPFLNGDRSKADFEEKARALGLRNGSNTPEHRATTTRPVADLATLKAQALAEITSRVTHLQAQIERINKMERLSADQKASIVVELNAQIASLTTLKAKIAADTDLATLREDMKSITKAYRVYAVTMPKAAIIAAADRIMTVSAQMDTISIKLSERVAAATSTIATTALADFKIKVADAKVQAQAAVSLVSALVADNGDAAIAASNQAALKSAKAKIDAGQADLKAARKDMETIMKAVRGKGEVHASAGN